MSDEFDRLLPKSGLQYWHDAGLATASPYEALTGVTIPDRSGNGRHVNQPTSGPAIETNAINGRTAVAWAGTQNPLVYTGVVTLRHLFIIASYTDATFSADYPGLITALTGVPILTGDASTTKFFNNSYGSNYKFRRRDVIFAENNQQAAMSGAFSIYEVSYSTGFTIDGIQYGRDRDFSARKWKGKLPESIGWNRVLTDEERRGVYEFLALKYLLWRRVSSGLNVWPFQADWAQPLNVDKPVLSSTAVSRAWKARAKGSAKKGLQPQFTAREPEELDTAVAFWDEHYPGSTFIYRDDAFSPSRDTEMRFISPLDSRSNDYRDIDYNFQALEV
jgi:hypothetical protein